MENIGLLRAKVRMFSIESTDVCLEEVRCFYFPKRVVAIGSCWSGLVELEASAAPMQSKGPSLAFLRWHDVRYEVVLVAGRM